MKLEAKPYTQDKTITTLYYICQSILCDDRVPQDVKDVLEGCTREVRKMIYEQDKR